MKWINAEAMVKVNLFDEDPEEYTTKQMTVEDFLESCTEDGCPTTIEAEPVRHGHWIECKGSNGKDYRKCSVCLHTQEITGLLNYCPICGAKMDEVNDEDN